MYTGRRTFLGRCIVIGRIQDNAPFRTVGNGGEVGINESTYLEHLGQTMWPSVPTRGCSENHPEIIQNLRNLEGGGLSKIKRHVENYSWVRFSDYCTFGHCTSAFAWIKAVWRPWLGIVGICKWPTFDVVLRVRCLWRSEPTQNCKGKSAWNSIFGGKI
jgi:hypothetical protein